MSKQPKTSGNLALEQKKVIVIEAAPKPEVAKLRVAAYCRVSSDSTDQLNSFMAQLNYYNALIASKENWTLVDLYADEGISGTSAEKRPDFQRLLSDCRRGRVDKVLVKSVSRFARNTRDYMDNEMILTFMMSQAQAESESMSTSIKWGFRKRFADGVVYYHYDTLLGYRRGSDGEPEIDPDEATVVRRVFARYLMGQSFQQICDGLMADGVKTASGNRKWYGSAVKSILQNEKYIGDAVLQKTFSEDLFERQRVKNEGQLPKID